jgi:hypothetical protein
MTADETTGRKEAMKMLFVITAMLFATGAYAREPTVPTWVCPTAESATSPDHKGCKLIQATHGVYAPGATRGWDKRGNIPSKREDDKAAAKAADALDRCPAAIPLEMCAKRARAKRKKHHDN